MKKLLSSLAMLLTISFYAADNYDVAIKEIYKLRNAGKTTECLQKLAELQKQPLQEWQLFNIYTQEFNLYLKLKKIPEAAAKLGQQKKLKTTQVSSQCGLFLREAKLLIAQGKKPQAAKALAQIVDLSGESDYLPNFIMTGISLAYYQLHDSALTTQLIKKFHATSGKKEKWMTHQIDSITQKMQQ